MDLVDIDKVLDSLELNEEEHKEEKPTIKHLQILTSNNMYPGDVIHMNIPVSANEAANDGNNYHSTTPNSTGDRVNRFAGVSQVFSSLDDYRKNVESLEAGIHLYNNANTKKSTYDDTKNQIQVTKDHVNAANMSESEEDPYIDDEINKFVSTDEEHGFSSNSITTSSSSTFSSGPSPALLSTESEASLGGRLVEKSVYHLQKKDDQSTIMISLQPEANTKNDGDKEPQRSEFDDLAVGLSSISLTNQGNTLSSEVTSSKHILKMDNLSSSLSLSQATKNYLNSEELPEQVVVEINNSQDQIDSSLKLENSELDRVNKAITAEQPNSLKDVMVTFGSTMDEVSDTELDSILQEIDAEMPSQTHTEIVYLNSERNDTTETTKKISKMDRKANMSNKDNIMTIGFSPNLSSGQKCNDAMNVDSFSQASTIEFAEDRTYEDDIDSRRGMNEMCDDYSEEQKNGKQSVGQKRQRPTTLDLPVRKINLYATAGQTPPGSRIFDQATSSSEEDSPENGRGLPPNDETGNLNDAAGHTPPERSDRSIVGTIFMETVDRNSASNYDEPMTVSDSVRMESQPTSQSLTNDMNPNLGKVPPIWVPDHEANACMQCQHKFTLLKRRHHCRACGQVLCSVCCSQKFKLEFLSNPESRVCVQCFLILTKLQQETELQPSSVTVTSPPSLRTPNPNPNNPMEYCSTIPPHRQVNPETMSCPAVIVPVGVLKKEGNVKKSRKRKSVMFSDGIRPGSDLASLDGKWSDAKHARKSAPTGHFTTENAGSTPNNGSGKTITRNTTKVMVIHDGNDSFIPRGENYLPPIDVSNKSEPVYEEVPNNADLIKRLHSESLKFVVQTNFYVFVKISHLKCCINKTVINFTTCGLHHVGNDEIIILLELDNSNEIPKDIFVHLNEIYWEASKGHPITELGFSMPKDLLFLGSREHGGFLFIRSTFQCLQDVNVPNSPFLIGVLIHRWEVPWAKIFPLRLMLRLGAQYRYYPSPHISVREREPVYAEIAQTIINLLADFRNYSYTLPTIKGMYIHMEDRRTNILIPRNRHDEVIKAINNSSDHILAMGANFSKKADGHLVCIQNIKAESTDSHSYSTQAINIQGQPRKVTGASFFVLNEALKSTSGLSGKCSIIEDGLMVQILPTKMIEIRNALINMKDIDIICGPVEAGKQQTELVYIQWVDDDIEINVGVRSPIDAKVMDGIPSIRVHSGVNISNTNHILKWTEVFIIEVREDADPQCKPPVDISRVSEQIAKKASVALHPFLDLLAANGNIKIGLRITLNQDNVCYEAGSQNEKLPPLYMNALDNELIPTLHKEASEIQKIIVLELIFHILNV